MFGDNYKRFVEGKADNHISRSINIQELVLLATPGFFADPMAQV